MALTEKWFEQENGFDSKSWGITLTGKWLWQAGARGGQVPSQIATFSLETGHGTFTLTPHTQRGGPPHLAHEHWQ